MAKGKFDMSEFLTPVEGVPESDTMREIAADDILDNPLNFYPRPDNGKLAELMESIRANGLLEPPTVVAAGDGKYRLISGHSRMSAVRLLAAYKDAAVAERFQRVLCRVLPSMTPEQEECAVIESNRQRIKSPALLAQEAERLTQIYIKRREAGENLPGRIRDRVAEAMQVNKTKLANLSAIKNGIKVPGIRRAWEEGRLPEAAALEIARMDDETQYRLLDWVIVNHRSYTIKDVQEFVKSRAKDEQAVEDEKYIELLGHIHERLERELRGCKNREEGIETLKKALRWAGGGSKEFGWQGEAKGLVLHGEDQKRILRPWATVWDMLAAMRMQDGPALDGKSLDILHKKSEPKGERNEELLALAWHESDIEPPNGAHIVFIDESGIVDDDEYINGRLKSGYTDWDEVLLWTMHPDDPSPTKAASLPEWLPLDAEHWPEEGALVVLSYPTGLGGSAYLTARCGGSASDRYPFVSTDAGISAQEVVDCKCDSWLLISERQRGKK
nr:MAG TPA: chromosome partitioning protein [Caudoviricetes sp.]